MISMARRCCSDAATVLFYIGHVKIALTIDIIAESLRIRSFFKSQQRLMGANVCPKIHNLVAIFPSIKHICFSEDKFFAMNTKML